jgi:carbonic anhydrase/acetyltransferase-like protein (isoleucine patch superfamily)
MPLILPFDDHEPEMHPTAWVAPNATLIGRVTLRENSSVYYGTVLRGDRAEIVLGAGSNLQDNVTVHCDPGTPTIIGSGVSAVTVRCCTAALSKTTASSAWAPRCSTAR